MSDGIREAASVQDAVAAHCVACGSRFRAVRWHEGIICPRCHSGEVKPIVAPGGAVDYCVADRSKGYAPADIRYAQWAKWCEIITPNQYELAFIKQSRQIQDGRPPTPIHEIMVQEGWIAESQAVRLLEFFCLPRPCEDDGRFVEVLRATFELDGAKVQEVQNLQQKAAAKYHEVPPICQLLLERHVINEAQMLAVLRLQGQDGYSALRIAREMTARPRSPSGIARLRAAWANPRVRYLLVVATLFCLGLGIWEWQTAARASQMVVTCNHCGKLGVVRWSKTLPVACPHCKNRLAYYALRCPKGHTFGVKNPYVPHSCPKCGSTAVRPIRPEDIVEGPSERKEEPKPKRPPPEKRDTAR